MIIYDYERGGGGVKAIKIARVVFERPQSEGENKSQSEVGVQQEGDRLYE